MPKGPYSEQAVPLVTLAGVGGSAPSEVKVTRRVALFTHTASKEDSVGKGGVNASKRAGGTLGRLVSWSKVCKG